MTFFSPFVCGGWVGVAIWNVFLVGLKTLKYITGLGNVKRELILKESAGFKNQVGFDKG
jgi:hypothetical protein